MYSRALGWWQSQSVILRDGLGALVLFMPLLWGLWSEGSIGDLSFGAWSVVFLVAGSAALALRRVRPVEVGLATAALAVAPLVFGQTDSGWIAAVACYAVAGWRPQRKALATVAGMMALTALKAPLSPWEWWLGDFLMLVVAAAAGSAAAHFRSQDAALAQAEANSEAMVANERARLTREFHDIVSHALGVVVIQANVADEQLRTDPDAAHEAIGAIGDTAKSALVDVRRLLSVLRAKQGAAGLRSAPPSRLSDLGVVFEGFGSTGLEVTLHLSKEVEETGESMQTCIYRIVQEALTNSVRHGLATEATVSIRLYNQQVVIEVSDNGRGAIEPVDVGHGLTGIHERAAAFCGSVDIETSEGGGFRLRVSLETELHPSPMTLGS